MRITLCLVFGLPAVGKTTFCRQLINHPGHTSLNKYLFSYDDLMPEQLIFEDDNSDGSLWKAHRNKVLQNVEDSILLLRSDKDLSSSGSEEPSNLNGLCNCFQNDASSDNHVFFIDDNFFYESMRYAYYQLARKLACSYCQIFIESPQNVDVLFERNRNRNAIVQEETIRKMNRIFEQPDPELNHWENNTISYDCLDVLSDDISSKSFEFIERCSSDIVKPVLTEAEMEKRREDRKKVFENYWHQVDQLLRKYVSKEMGIAKNERQLSKVELKSLAQRLNDRRKIYLMKIHDDENRIGVDGGNVCLFDEKWSNAEHEKMEFFFKECFHT